MNQPLPPIDTSVKLPRGVAASSAKSEAIHAAAYKTEGEPPPANGEPPPANGSPPADARPQPTNPTPPAPAPASQATPPQNQPPPETVEDWKQRYNSTKGRLDAANSDIANMKSRMASLESLVANLQSRPATQPAPPPPKAQTKRVTDDDVKEYGEDMIKVVQKAALDAVEPIIEQRLNGVRTEVQTRLSDLSTKTTAVERETAVSAHQRLLDYLDKNVPNFRTINTHPKFAAWLGLTDPLSGVIRKTLLDQAVKRGDALRTAEFYRRFLAEEGVPAPANGQGNPPPPANGKDGNGVAKVDLAALAAPGRPAASGAPPPVPDQSTEIITRAQISAFYTRKNKGEYTPEKAAELEAEIFKAQKEGRIR